jgi:DNA gyrase subunit A
VRVFKGRDSMGVRGISSPRATSHFAWPILNHLDATPEERAAYLKRSPRRAAP